MEKYLNLLITKKTAKFLGLFFLCLLVYTLFRKTVDYHNFWMISRELIYGNVDIFQKHTAFSYPPFFYCIVSFFALFKLKVSLAFWFIFNLILLCSSIAMILKMLYSEKNFYKKDSTNWAKVFLPFILAAGIIADNFYLGQSNILVFFLCVTAIYLSKHNAGFAGGLFLAAAVSVKITPLMFLLYFIFKRRYTVVFGCLLGIPVFTLLVPALYIGFDRSLYLSKELLESVILPFVRNDAIIRETVYYTNSNQSLDAFLIRHFTDFGASNYGGLHRILDIPIFTEKGAKLLGVILKIALLLSFAVVFFNNKKFRKAEMFEYPAVFFLMLYISPSSWLNHYLSVIFAYYVAMSYITDDTNGKFDRMLLTIGLSFAFLLTSTGLTIHLQSYSGMFLGNFILFITMLIVAFRENYLKPVEPKYH